MQMLQNDHDSSPIVKTEKNSELVSHVSPSLAAIAYPLGRYVVIPFYFGNIDITGQENLPLDAPVIIAPTHRSRWDAIMLPYATGRYVTGRDLRFMVTADEMKGVQGCFIHHLGGFPVDVRHPKIGTLRHGIDLLKDRQMLVIFPEGGIFRNDQVNPLKPGLARLALQAELQEPGLGVKIVPMSLRYYPTIPCFGSNVRINIGEPLNVSDYLTNSPKRDGQNLTDALEKAMKSIDFA